MHPTWDALCASPRDLLRLLRHSIRDWTEYAFHHGQMFFIVVSLEGRNESRIRSRLFTSEVRNRLEKEWSPSRVRIEYSQYSTHHRVETIQVPRSLQVLDNVASKQWSNDAPNRMLPSQNRWLWCLCDVQFVRLVAKQKSAGATFTYSHSRTDLSMVVNDVVVRFNKQDVFRLERGDKSIDETPSSTTNLTFRSVWVNEMSCRTRQRRNSDENAAN